MQSEKIAELAKALVKVQKSLRGAKKDSENPFFKAKYADLESVWEACRELLSANGLAIVQTMGFSDKGVLLRTTLLHESGEFIFGEQPIMPVKADPQSIGSAISYARRYGLAAIVGVVQIDDDAESTMGRPTAKPANNYQQRQPAPSTTKPPVPLEGVAGFLLPFGKEKNTPLGALPRSSIESALKWATEKGKFIEFQDAAIAYLASLQATETPFDDQQFPEGF